MGIEFPKIDKRSNEELVAEMESQYLDFLPNWKPHQGDAGLALIKIFAHMAEEVIDRLNQVPQKHFAAFLDMLGISRLPAAPARAPVTFYLSTGAEQHALIPKGTQVAAGEKDVVFETRTSILATPAKLVKVFAVDGRNDEIYQLPHEPGKEGEPPGVENLQAHFLYLGHGDLFNTAGKVNFELTGLNGPFENLSWEYPANGWCSFVKVDRKNGKLILEKDNVDEIEEQEINGIKSRWIRCRAESSDLNQPLQIEPGKLKVAVKPDEERTLAPDMIFCNDFPLDTGTQEIYPFGTRPHQYSTFYISSREAFSKKNAKITLYFNIANASEIEKNDSLRLSWEYGTAGGWNVIKGIQTGDTNGICRFWDSGDVSFTCPGDIEPVYVEGQENYWIRVRISDGDYSGESKIQPPIISTITISYDYETESTASPAPEHCITYNNLEYKDLPDKPFYSMEEQHQALYLGFDKKIQKGPISMYFSIEESENLEKDAAKVQWYYSGEKEWQVLETKDNTQNMTESGTVEFFVPDDFVKRLIFAEELYWFKAAASHDSSQMKLIKSFCGGSRGAVFSKRAPLAAGGKNAGQGMKIKGIHINTTFVSQVETIEDEILGASEGEANQEFRLRRFPVITEELRVDESRTLTKEQEQGILEEKGKDAVEEIQDESGNTTAIYVRWQAVGDFFSSTPGSRHYVIDRVSGRIRFGDGIHGMIPPIGTNNIKASYQVGGGTRGNVDAGEISELRTAIPYVDSVSNPEPAQGGADTEQMAAVFKRGPYLIRHRDRAVTKEDFERLAAEVSSYIARPRCIIKGGDLTIFILPDDKSDKPMPTPTLKKRVKEHLLERCPGTLAPGNLVVGDPDYVEAAVNACIVPVSIEAAASLELKILKELRSFFHPLTGGPESRGWEFGRSLYISDVYVLLEGIDGVDHVEDLLLNDKKEDIVLDNEFQILCSGQHKITLF